MTTGLLLKRVSRPTGDIVTADDRRMLVGLADPDGQELDAGWYLRQRYQQRMEWKVGSPEPWAGDAGAEWTVAYLLIFDASGREIRRQALEWPVRLSGAMKPPSLTAKAIEYRKAHGIPLEGDPYGGDVLVVNLTR